MGFLVILVLLDNVMYGFKAPLVHLGEKKKSVTNKRMDGRMDKVTTSLLELLIAAKTKFELENNFTNFSK